MIQSLHIQNYALIDEVRLDFADGLTIITGETGAGKSILLGALGLIMGERADLKSLYDTEKKCIVEGTFHVAPYGLKDFFETSELDYEDTLILRREISPAGKSRAFVNDTPVKLDILRKLSGSLIDLHRQFDTRDINDVSFQLRMLDALAGNKTLLQAYRQAYTVWKQTQKQLHLLLAQQASSNKEMDFLSFQLNELKEAQLIPNEQGLLEVELKALENAEDIKRHLSEVNTWMADGDQSILEQLRFSIRSIEQVGTFRKDLTAYSEKMHSLLLELQEVQERLLQISEDTDMNDERTAVINERLDIIYRLQKKHQVQHVDALLSIQSNLQSQIDNFSDLDGRISSLTQQLEEQKLQVLNLGNQLSQKRQEVVPSFQQKVVDTLGKLAMPHSQLSIQITPFEQPSPTGLDEVNYLFTANKGGRLQPVGDVASGGELSRLTLVTKSLVASSIPLPTLIFDEIDAGVSGDVAQKMGDILKNLATGHQIIVITHSPQVASKAHTHYFVYKKEKDDRTVSRIKALTPDERIRSIAVMLSQNPPSEAALANAQGLIEQ